MPICVNCSEESEVFTSVPVTYHGHIIDHVLWCKACAQQDEIKRILQWVRRGGLADIIDILKKEETS